MGPILMLMNWISKDISGPPLHISRSLGFVQITVIMKFMISYMWTKSQHSKAHIMFCVKDILPHPHWYDIHRRRSTSVDLHSKPIKMIKFHSPPSFYEDAGAAGLQFKVLCPLLPLWIWPWRGRSGTPSTGPCERTSSRWSQTSSAASVAWRSSL